MVIFNSPYVDASRNRVKVVCVYRMTFDGGCFYIGSTIDFKKRISKWKERLVKGVNKNYLVSRAFSKCSVVDFSILELVNEGIDCRGIEDIYLKANTGNPLLLNLSLNAFVSGLKKSNSEYSKPYNIVNKQRCAKFDLDGNKLGEYDTVKSAAKSINVLSISRCFRCSSVSILGYKFRRINKDNTIEEPPIEKPIAVKTYKKYKKRTSVMVNRKENTANHKAVSKFSLDGIYIETYPSMTAAAKSVGLKDQGRIGKLLNGRDGKTCKGFKWAFV